MADGGEKTPLLSGSGSDTSYLPSRAGRQTRRDSEPPVSGYETFGGLRHSNATFPQMAPNQSGPEDYRPTGSDMAMSLSTLPSTRSRPASKEELLFNLKFAHLNLGTDWLNEVAAASADPQDPHIYQHIKASLKDFPLTMGQKKQLSQQLKVHLEAQNSPSGQAQPTPAGYSVISTRVSVPPGTGATWGARVASLSGDIGPAEMWTTNITKISAYFGSYVASYFLLLRFLVYLNVFLGVVMVLFVSMPHLIHGDFHDESIHEGFFGKLSKTAFFYGAYSNKSFTADALGTTWTYNSPLYYFLTWAAVYFLAMVTIVSSMFIRYRRIKQTDYSGDNPYASHALLGWDYSMTSKEGSKTRSRALTTSLKEMMREEKTKDKQKKRSKHKVRSLRVFGNLFNLAVLGSSAYLIILVAQNTLVSDDVVSGEVADFLKQYELSLLVMAMKLVVPPILTFLLRFEYYTPRTQVKVEIGRIALYYIASLIGFLASTYSVAKDCRGKSRNITDISTNNTMFDIQSEEPRYCCWENHVGQQILQLVFLDLIAHIFFRLGKTLALALFVKYYKSDKLGKPSFQVSRLNLDLVYGQCLVWLGLYFMPTLSLLVGINQVIIFYLTYWISLTCCAPPVKVFRASRSGTFDLFVLAASLFICMMPMAIGIMELEPSASCGPYKPDLRVYDSLVVKVGGFPGYLRDAVRFISTPAFVLPVLVALLFLVIYYQAKSVTHKKEADQLRDYLSYTRKVEMRRMVAYNRDNKGPAGGQQTKPKPKPTGEGERKEIAEEQETFLHIRTPTARFE